MNVLSCKFREVNFQRHDSKGFLEDYLKQLNITWPYSHEDLLLGELSRQGSLIKSKILTPSQMVQTDGEAERKKDEIEKNKSIIEWHTDASSSSIFLYNIDSDNEDTACSSSQTPSPIREITPPPKQGEEMEGSQATVKIPSEKHCSNNLVVLKQEGPSIYNNEEVFGSFTFDLNEREVN